MTDILNDPRIALILNQLRDLTTAQRVHLDTVWRRHVNLHAGAQVRLRHRAARGDLEFLKDTLAVEAHVFQAADTNSDDMDGVGHAAADAAFAAINIDRLTADEARLFDAPWRDTLRGGAA